MRRGSEPAREPGNETEFDAENPAVEEVALEEDLYADEGLDGALGSG